MEFPWFRWSAEVGGHCNDRLGKQIQSGEDNLRFAKYWANQGRELVWSNVTLEVNTKQPQLLPKLGWLQQHEALLAIQQQQQQHQQLMRKHWPKNSLCKASFTLALSGSLCAKVQGALSIANNWGLICLPVFKSGNVCMMHRACQSHRFVF